MKTENAVFDYLKEKVLRETLKFAAGHHIFCKYCGDVLDWKTTVVVTASKDGESATVVVCTKCFNPKGLDKIESQGYTVEVDKWDS